MFPYSLCALWHHEIEEKGIPYLKQGSMIVNEYLNSFIQLSRYASEDINTDEKK
jgi:hypothetical protein